MSLPPKIDLALMRGDSKTLTFVLEDDTGDPIDLGDAQVWLTAKKAYTDPDAAAVFQLTMGGAISIVGANANGTIAIAIAPADTNKLPLKETVLVYDLQVKVSGGDVQTAFYGALTVLPDVTNAG